MPKGEISSAEGPSFLIKDLPTTLQCHVLDEQEWTLLRDIRLTALLDSPGSFLSTYDKEKVYSEARWRSEFSRGIWILLEEKERFAIGLIGVTEANDVPSSGRYVEYLWVSSQWRRHGVASALLRAVRERLSASGINTIWLWILDGNEAARNLYEKHGFVTTNERQVLQDNPGRYEERMKLSIS